MDRASESLKRALAETARENQVYWAERDGDLLLALNRASQLRAKAQRAKDYTAGALALGEHCFQMGKVWEIVHEYRKSERELPELAEQLLAAESQWRAV